MCEANRHQLHPAALEGLRQHPGNVFKGDSLTCNIGKPSVKAFVIGIIWVRLVSPFILEGVRKGDVMHVRVVVHDPCLSSRRTAGHLRPHRAPMEVVAERDDLYFLFSAHLLPPGAAELDGALRGLPARRSRKTFFSGSGAISESFFTSFVLTSVGKQ